LYRERSVGLRYRDTELKIQVHFLMFIATASLFAIGVGLFIWDFFRTRPRFEIIAEGAASPAQPTRVAVT
jgi:nitric oxide reductase subunit B